MLNYRKLLRAEAKACPKARNQKRSSPGLLGVLRDTWRDLSLDKDTLFWQAWASCRKPEQAISIHHAQYRLARRTG